MRGSVQREDLWGLGIRKASDMITCFLTEMDMDFALNCLLSMGKLGKSKPPQKHLVLGCFSEQ